MTITTTIEVRAVVTVVESPGQTGARQADGAPLEPSFEREARIESVELPDAEGAGLRWRKELPQLPGWYWVRPSPTSHPYCVELINPHVIVDHVWETASRPASFVEEWEDWSFAGPIPLPCHATPAHLPVESLSPTDAQRIMRLAEREEVL